MSAIDGRVAADEPPVGEEEAPKASSGSASAASASCWACALSSSLASDGADLARVLREAERRVRRPREQRIERADQVEHRVVDHRPLARIGRVELVEAVLVAQVRHDRAALPERAARQAGLLEHRRQVRAGTWRGTRAPSSCPRRRSPRSRARRRARRSAPSGCSRSGEDVERVSRPCRSSSPRSTSGLLVVVRVGGRAVVESDSRERRTRSSIASARCSRSML